MLYINICQNTWMHACMHGVSRGCRRGRGPTRGCAMYNTCPWPMPVQHMSVAHARTRTSAVLYPCVPCFILQTLRPRGCGGKAAAAAAVLHYLLMLMQSCCCASYRARVECTSRPRSRYISVHFETLASSCCGPHAHAC